MLAAGGYDVLSGLRSQPPRLAVTAAGLALLAGMDAAERRGERWPCRGRGGAVGVLLVRAALVELVVAYDVSGTASLLRLLVAFWAQFALGAWATRVVAGCYALGLIGLVSAGVRLTPGATGGWNDPQTVSALVMSMVALALTLVVAGLVSTLDGARRAAQQMAVRLAEAQSQVAESAAAAERGRLARDIHDDLGHHLTALAVQLQKAELFLDRDPAVAARALQDAREAGRQALGQVRRSVASVRDVARFELSPALRALADPSLERLDSLEHLDAEPCVRLAVRGDEDGVPATVLLAVYRVVQEALTNARRHAAAQCVDVRVELDADRGVELSIEDDGQGFVGPPAGPDHTGHGLTGMRERVELLGGRLTVSSGRTGTLVHAWLPRTPVAVP